MFGSDYPEADVEIISITYNFFKEIGIKNLKVKLNSIGSDNCRKLYKDELRKFLRPHLSKLSKTSRNRFENNPLRILDTKIDFEIELLKEVPKLSDYLSDDDKIHFDEVKYLLDVLSIPYTIDEQMVRGLDYYSRTTFEITSESLGAQNALCGGGRYDKLVELLSGKPTPAVGFAAGIERLILALEANSFNIEESPPQFVIIGLTDQARHFGQSIAETLRRSGYFVTIDLLRRSLKSLLREANRYQSKYAIIIGEEELSNNSVQVKNLKNGSQATIELNNLIKYIADLEI